ncbi:Uncharacterised protein [Serratia fonticola]|nr:Uncharacterised protein [Serratia fonticola]CAI1088196.1 Uncharacterised protein [Serratia fonticola]
MPLSENQSNVRGLSDLTNNDCFNENNRIQCNLTLQKLNRRKGYYD